MNTSAVDEIERLIEQAVACTGSAPLEALAFAKQAHSRLDAQTPAASVARAWWARGLARHHAGQHVDGLSDLQHALKQVPADAPALRSRVLRGLAIGCQLMGRLDAALAWATQSLDAARSDGDPTLVADAMLSVGVVYSQSGDAESGLQHYREVLALFEPRGDTLRCLRVLNNMGINCKNLNRLDESAAHYARAMALADELGSSGLRATLAINLGETQWRLGRHAEARLTLQAALSHLQVSGQPDAQANARSTLGRVLLDLGECDAAQAEFERALQLLAATGSRNHLAPAHLGLAELHKAAGRFETALRHHEAFHAAERAQFNEQSDARLRTLRVQLELADAQHQTELHRLQHEAVAKTHAELKQLHADLQAADIEKTRLLGRLNEQSRTDALTGLANRRRLDERLSEEFARARRHGHPLAVAMCDLDFFKRINDRLGHATGDAVLRRVAAILRERCRSTDLVARYGGEEFCIVFLDTDAALAATVCEALREAIAADDWRAVHPALSGAMTVTLSMGLSDDLRLANHEQLLADADTHLYEAKHAGKNRVEWRGSGRAASGLSA